MTGNGAKRVHPRLNALKKKNNPRSTNGRRLPPPIPSRKKIGGRKTKRRRRKSSKYVKRRRRRKTRKTRRRRRRRRQRGGNKGCSNCQNPFVGKPTSRLGGGNYHTTEPPVQPPRAQLTQQPMKGGGIWQDLGLTVPKEMYYDGMSYLKNIKNTWVGDNHESTSDVLKQPIATSKSPTSYPVDYFKEFSEADANIAPQLTLSDDA
tara:strand:- start:7496 stop:8110 length:615 start_codon:yes stop_codon:yes gene_type:complete